MWLSIAYVLLLGLVAFVRPPTTDASEDTVPQPTPVDPSRRTECVVCGIDRVCDPGSGQCVFVDATPLPCVKGTKFDERAGFCLPTGELSAPVATQAPAEEFPDSGIGEPNIDLPGFGSSDTDDEPFRPGDGFEREPRADRPGAGQPTAEPASEDTPDPDAD